MRALALASVAMLSTSGCAGPCKKVSADRAALLARSEGVEGASARVRIPLALANKLIAQVVAEQEPVGLPTRLGAFLDTDVRGRIQEVALVPAGARQIGVAVTISLLDDEGHLATLRGHTKLVATVEPGDPNALAERPPSVAIGLRWDTVEKLEVELSDRVKAAAGGAIAKVAPDAVKKRVPKWLLERGSAHLVERVTPSFYHGMRDVLLARLGEITTIRVPLPPMPLSRVDIAPAPGDVPAIDLLVHSQLPIRAAVGAAMPATPDAINVEVSGSAAAEAANWSIANGVAPARYDRELKPDKGGSYVPHFDWRPDRGDKPMVVHMFRVEGTCAHFAVAAQPHLEVKGDKIHAYVANKELEQADATLMFRALANVKDGVSSTTSETKQAPAHRTLRLGDRELTTRLTRATIGGGDLRASLAVELGPRIPDGAAGLHRPPGESPLAGGATPRGPAAAALECALPLSSAR